MYSTNEDGEYGPIFKLCNTIRHILFWFYGLYVQISMIYTGVEKLHIA